MLGSAESPRDDAVGGDADQTTSFSHGFRWALNDDASWWPGAVRLFLTLLTLSLWLIVS
ncbi:hypothetical protein BH18ACT6_BH18ACT6_07860 [soil metagenome]